MPRKKEIADMYVIGWLLVEACIFGTIAISYSNTSKSSISISNLALWVYQSIKEKMQSQYWILRSISDLVGVCLFPRTVYSIPIDLHVHS